MLHPELRERLEQLGASIKVNKQGHSEVQVPGADAAFVFHPDGRVFRQGLGQRISATSHNQELLSGRQTPGYDPVEGILNDVVHGHVIHSGDNHYLNAYQIYRHGRLETHVVLWANEGTERVHHEHSDSTHPFLDQTPTPPNIHHLARAALETRDKTPLNMLVDEMADHNGVSHLVGPERYARVYGNAIKD